MSDNAQTRSVVADPCDDASEGSVGSAEKTYSLLNSPATYFLIGINVVVFVLMAHRASALSTFHLWRGAQPSYGRLTAFDFTSLLTKPFPEQTLVSFGSCVPEAVLRANQWWRVLSSVFVHVTLLHLLLNMWCLWNLGVFGERLLGRPGLIAVYLLTGAAGMMLSVLLSAITGHLEDIVAGASGAVFGLAGILIVLLSNKRLAAPWRELRALRWQVIFFAAANLFLGELPTFLQRFLPQIARGMHLDMGALPRIDNSAHLGGFLCGLALGLPLFPRMTSGRSSYRARQVLVFTSAGLLLTMVGYAAAVFQRGS